ncbi:MAG: class A beta-lactamase-related serine hydrolase [Gammaproteobacteria bacterium]|nr:MAG: class A beta-lactamase-related serine hydrolase [Gammaproteobacteria bacterium]
MKLHLKILIYISFILFSFSVSGENESYNFSSLSKFLNKEISKGRYPGFLTLIKKDGKVIYQDVSGFNDVKNKTPLQRDSLFRIYSMTKPVTGVALMIAVDQGMLKLSDPVSKYIPEFKDTRVLLRGNKTESLKRDITLLDLATHTSGLAYTFSIKGELQDIYLKEKIFPYYALDTLDDDIKPEKLYENICSFSKKVASVPLAHQPGEKWTYSIGMDILGCVIEKASNMTFGDFLKSNLFDPLNMKDTFFKVPEEKQQRMTNLYAHHNAFKAFSIELPDNLKGKKPKMHLVDSQENSLYYKDITVEDGGSGLVSTGDDYLNFADMLLNKGVFNGKKILSSESYKVLISNQLNENNSRFSGFGMGITLGIALDSRKIRLRRGDNSFFWGGAAKTKFWVDPENNLTVVHMTQLIGTPRDLTNKIDKLIYKEIKNFEKSNKKSGY